MDYRDVPYECHRTRAALCPDGLPYWLSLIRHEDGIVQHRGDLRFSTEQGAFAAADVLVATGSAFAVYVNYEAAQIRRAR